MNVTLLCVLSVLGIIVGVFIGFVHNKMDEKKYMA
jgi:uncharacterized membrane-anchored protein YhcB (DUF1043 family)